MGRSKTAEIWAATVKQTHLKRDYEAKIVRQGSFEISLGTF